MAFLTREKLLERHKFKIEKVELGDGDFIYVRQMSGHEKDRFEQTLLLEVKQADGSITYDRAMDDFRAKLASCTVCDEDGVLLLSPDDAAVLSRNITAARLEVIINVAQELNKITQSEKEKMVKNSDADRNGNSTSGYAVSSDSVTQMNC